MEALILQTAMFPEMKTVQEEEEEEGRALQHLCHLLADFLCRVPVGQVLGFEDLKLWSRPLRKSGPCSLHCHNLQTVRCPLSYI